MTNLIEACENTIQRKDGWLDELTRAIAISEKSDWHSLYERGVELLADPANPQRLDRLNDAWIYFLRWKCSGCNDHGQERYSCGCYAGRYCDIHWDSSGYRDEGDRIDYLDAGEYETEIDAY
jgi:hypothetical protein